MNKIFLDKSREDLAKLFKGDGVEIGVAAGEFSKVILDANPDTKLIGIDSYQAYKGYRDYTLPQTFERLYNEMMNHVGNHPRFSLLKGFSSSYVSIFQDESLDFVYIDGNHSYEHVMEDITLWYPKVKPGGIVSGDDYVKRKGQDKYYNVIQAVDEFVEKHELPGLTIYTKDRSNWMIRKWK